MTSSIFVTSVPRKKASLDSGTKPEHWDDLTCSGFHNPWSSWRKNGFSDHVGLFSQFLSFPSVSKATKQLLPIRTPTWGVVKPNSELAKEKRGDKIISTWLGHACFLVELPSRSESGERGARILFDPVFSDRCSPSQWVGPKRFTPPPCKIEDIPEVDAIVISHNHYDHLDTHTIDVLSKRPRKPHFFAPLGNGSFFKCMGIPDSHVHIMDWWDSKRVEISTPSHKDGPARKVVVELTCTPSQHFTGRSTFDRFKTLWASWAVEEVRDSPQNTSAPNHADSTGAKVFFAGDTGYRAVMDGQDEEKVPTCPVFKEIGEQFGGFDFAMIPIGAYMPRQFMSPIHCAPQDSVLLFKDIQARKALGMHWGTWVLTTEDVLEPPKKLAEECKKVGIEDGAFGVCDIGETMFF